MGKLKLLLACLLIGAVKEIAPEKITMCSRPEFVDGPVYVEDSTVCSCDVYHSSTLYCTNMSQDSLSQFRETFSQFVIHVLYILDSNFFEIKSASFDNISVHTIVFYRTKIHNFQLFSAPSRFQGPLYLLKFEKCEVTNWDFAYLPTVSELSHFTIIDPINPVHDYSIINHLPSSTKYVELTNCGISSTDQISSFSKLNISSLHLERNNLTTIKRSVFPRPAYNLTTIDLSDNPVVSLPEDAFTEMPWLYWIILKNTLLTTLPSNVFLQVLIGRTCPFYIRLRILGIPLHCDNKIAWMKNQNELFQFEKNVICQSPEAFAGMKLKDVLTYRDMS